MGRPIVEVTSSEESLEQADEIMSELRAGRSWSGACVVQHKDGSTFPAMVTDTPAYDRTSYIEEVQVGSVMPGDPARHSGTGGYPYLRWLPRIDLRTASPNPPIITTKNSKGKMIRRVTTRMINTNSISPASFSLAARGRLRLSMPGR